MNICVCGDSFSSLDSEYKGMHWSELLPFNVVNLANSGVSNMQIALQVQQSIKKKSDYVIVNFTDPLRFDIRSQCRKRLSEKVASSGQCRPIIELEAIKPLFGSILDNFTEHFGNGMSSTFLTVPLEMLDDKTAYVGNAHLDDVDRQELIKHYVAYDHVLLRVIQNYFTIVAALSMLELSGIRYSFNLGLFESEVKLLELTKLPEIDFSLFAHNMNDIHLPSFDYVKPPLRPLFHIHNKDDHIKIAAQYEKIINERM